MPLPRAGALTLVLLGACRTVGADPVSLVRDGRPVATIVTASDAPDTVVRAGAELQEYIQRSTGALLPILTEERPAEGAAIFVGESRFTTALGIGLEGVGPEGYRWLTGDGWLAIIGRDHRGDVVHGLRNPWRLPEVYNADLKLGAFGEAGTLYGVYHLLERFLGVRWFMPGELGTVVPRHEDVSIPDLDVSRAPDFEYRYPWLCNFADDPDSALWCRHVGFGGACPVQAIDSFAMFLKYKDDHPDWFALVDGQRDFDNLCCIVGGGNLCLSSEGLLRQMAADIGAYFDAHPEQRFFPVAPNDGMLRVCECERCAPQVQDDRGDSGRFSNYVWGFVAKVAHEVTRTHPDRFIGTIAYANYLEPPDNLDHLPPNVAVMFCQSRSTFADPDRLRAARSRVEQWQAKADRIYLWEYYRANLPPFPWCPVAYPHLIADDLAALKGISSGEFIEAESWGSGEAAVMHHPAMQHLNLYVTAKCLWDADLDVDALLEDYYASFYGPAAEQMATFWGRAEEIHCARPLDGVVAKYPLGDLDRLLEPLDAAAGATDADSAYGRRVELVRADVRKLRDALGNPLVTKPPEMDCYVAADPIQIDGSLDDPGWRGAIPQSLVRKGGEAPEYHSWMVSVHDDTYLYIGVANVEPDLDALRTLAGGDDPTARIWDDDCVEVFVSPDAADPARAYQVIVNAAGLTWDRAYGLPPDHPLTGREEAWECKGLRAAVGKTDSRWCVELAIPLESVDLAAAELPAAVALNVFRARSCGEPPVHTTWAPVLTARHYTPERFGTLRLMDHPFPPVETERLVPESTDDIGSGATEGEGWYAPGGILDGKPFVGNPNALYRRDRMVIRFHLAALALAYGERGVERARLRLIPADIAGPDDTRRLELSHLLYDTGALTWKDVVSDRVATVGVAEAHRDTVKETGLSFDVTEAVNADLALGRPGVAFRLSDLESEKGNPDMQPDGLVFPDYRSGNLWLELDLLP